MELRDKIQFVLDKYNRGEKNDYSTYMLKLLEARDRKEMIITENSIIIPNSHTWSIQELIGYCIMENNVDFFKEKSNINATLGVNVDYLVKKEEAIEEYLKTTEHCPH